MPYGYGRRRPYHRVGRSQVGHSRSGNASGILGTVRNLRTIMPDNARWKTYFNQTFLCQEGDNAIANTFVCFNSLYNPVGPSFGAATQTAEHYALIRLFYNKCKVHSARMRVSISLKPGADIVDDYLRTYRLGFIPVLAGQSFTLPIVADNAQDILDQQGGILGPVVDITKGRAYLDVYLQMHQLTGDSREAFEADETVYVEVLNGGSPTLPPIPLGGQLFVFNVTPVDVEIETVMEVELTYYVELLERNNTTMLGSISNALSAQALATALSDPDPSPLHRVLTPEEDLELRRIVSLVPPALDTTLKYVANDPRLQYPWGPDEVSITEYYSACYIRSLQVIRENRKRNSHAQMQGLVPTIPYSNASSQIEDHDDMSV